MNIDEIYILEDRGFVFINGEDAKDFLQNGNMEQKHHFEQIFNM